jgi:hypothetical protein
MLSEGSRRIVTGHPSPDPAPIDVVPMDLQMPEKDVMQTRTLWPVALAVLMFRAGPHAAQPKSGAAGQQEAIVFARALPNAPGQAAHRGRGELRPGRVVDEAPSRRERLRLRALWLDPIGEFRDRAGQGLQGGRELLRTPGAASTW